MKVSEQVAALERELEQRKANPALVRAWEYAYWELLTRLVAARMEVLRLTDPAMYEFLNTPVI